MEARTHWGKTTKGVIGIFVLVVAVCVSLTVLIPRGASPVRFDRVSFPAIEDVPRSAWDTLSHKRVYFGHQSVGFNIVDGLSDIMDEHPWIEFNVVETHDPADFEVPVFAHSRIGRNTDPQSKIDAFKEFVEGGIAERADIALFKLCYVDVTASTDVNELFAVYQNTMSDLRARFPATAFVHVTVPHTSMQTGVKAGLQRFLGRSVRGDADNVKRSRFNDMLRQEYEGKEPVFDLALRETTSPHGMRASYGEGKTAFQALEPAYTQDGGHLNEAGRTAVSEQLLITLARLSE